MSRDRRDPSEGNDLEPSAGPSAELLSAYVDGVAELPADERRAVERRLADDPRAQADADAVRDLLGRLRALPPTYDGGEPPDWAAMERSIRQAVAAEAPRPWWRSWRWLVPAMTCTAAAAVALALWPRLAADPGIDPGAAHHLVPPPGDPPPPAREPPGDDVVALWLDGSEVDVDLTRPEAVEQVLGDQMLGDGPAARSDELEAAHAPLDEIGLLPAAGMAWIDDLDDAALDRAERLLARPPAGGAPAAPARSKG